MHDFRLAPRISQILPAALAPRAAEIAIACAIAVRSVRGSRLADASDSGGMRGSSADSGIEIDSVISDQGLAIQCLHQSPMALAGVAAGWIVAPPPATMDGHAASSRGSLPPLGWRADLDLLVGAHSGPTHGLGAAVIAGVVAVGESADLRRIAQASARIGASRDGGSPTRRTRCSTGWGPTRRRRSGSWRSGRSAASYYESPWHVFMAISRRYWLPEFWTSTCARSRASC